VFYAKDGKTPARQAGCLVFISAQLSGVLNLCQNLTVNKEKRLFIFLTALALSLRGNLN